MKASTESDLMAMTRSAECVATKRRQAAATRIVRSFRAHVDGCGSGPTDEDVKTFARLVAEEHRWGRRLAQCVLKTEVLSQAMLKESLDDRRLRSLR